jgi:hypothetical protein
LFKLTSDYTDKLSRLVADYTASRREYDLKIKASLDSVNRRISFLDSEINNYFKQLGLSGIEVNKKPNYRSTENKRWNKRKRVTYESKK